MQGVVRLYADRRIKQTCFTSFASKPTNFFYFTFASILERRNG